MSNFTMPRWVKVLMLKGEQGERGPKGPKGDQGDPGVSGDYATIANKPSINGVTLDGNKTSANLGISSYVPVYAISGVNPRSRYWLAGSAEDQQSEISITPIEGQIYMIKDDPDDNYAVGTLFRWDATRVAYYQIASYVIGDGLSLGGESFDPNEIHMPNLGTSGYYGYDQITDNYYIPYIAVDNFGKITSAQNKTIPDASTTKSGLMSSDNYKAVTDMWKYLRETDGSISAGNTTAIVNLGVALMPLHPFVLVSAMTASGKKVDIADWELSSISDSLNIRTLTITLAQAHTEVVYYTVISSFAIPQM